MIEKFKQYWRHKQRRRWTIAIAIVLLLSIPVRCGGPYKGRAIDKSTGQPIVGAVAVATWTTVLIGGTTRCLDAAEDVTDEKGEFLIKGSRGPFLGLFTGEMRIYVYKVGYRRVDCGWDYIENPGSCFQKPRGFVDGYALFPLERVLNDDLETSSGSPPHISCGRKDGKPLSAHHKEGEKYYDLIRSIRKKRKALE